MVFLGESAGAEPKRRLWRIKRGGSGTSKGLGDTVVSPGPIAKGLPFAKGRGSCINNQTNKDTFLIKPGHLKKPFLCATIKAEGNGFVFTLP